MADVPHRTTHNDAGLHRVLEERATSQFTTVATYATEAEALAFLEGARLAPSIDAELAQHTYDRAIAKKGHA